MSGKAPIQKLSGHPPVNLGIASIIRILGKPEGAPFGIGTAQFQPGNLESTTAYDEAVFCLSGSLAITSGDQRMELEPGDLVWIPEGTTFVYHVTEACKILYATCPPV